MGNILGSIRRFLFARVNREFLTFLFFLAVAAFFWLLTTLNESFEQELKVAVRVVGAPNKVVLTSGDSDTLRFTIRDKGISLVTYMFSSRLLTVDVDFKRYAHDGRGTVPANDLLHLLESHLPASAKAISVKPEAHTFYYNNGESRKVPVKYVGKVEPDMLCYISGISYSPDSLVTIYAPPSKLDSINAVYTEPLNVVGFRDSIAVVTRLHPITGVKMVPSEVTLHFQTDMLTEGSVSDVPIVGINMPPGKVLRTFPAKLTVSFVTGLKNYQNITPADFLIVADYKELSRDSNNLCNVYLRKQPLDIRRVELQQEQVEFLIEEHEEE
jgi:hypothetical protein